MNIKEKIKSLNAWKIYALFLVILIIAQIVEIVNIYSFDFTDTIEVSVNNPTLLGKLILIFLCISGSICVAIMMFRFKPVTESFSRMQAILGILFVIFFSIAIIGLKRSIENTSMYSSETAAWVQAVSSITMIAAAIWAVLYQSGNSKRKEEEETIISNQVKNGQISYLIADITGFFTAISQMETIPNEHYSDLNFNDYWKRLYLYEEKEISGERINVLNIARRSIILVQAIMNKVQHENRLLLTDKERNICQDVIKELEKCTLILSKTFFLENIHDAGLDE
ncbi:hypothetical protein NB643_01660 [Oxalobacter aliiformigenes]|uniref:Uncharacterized protein n=1 Tax=Oxalobacter aliiformigenes TaxID=2946593 RepID=A0ABY7JKD9_9BURK|nr:hypothetical protein [Oxalobacter aliiformigenes]WAV92998.1 hypothetical protein NB641_09455 [Oxalobacter aliiformigenes]WAV95498.1 hypothetical protein NB643_01660 [Oxalobacter aliiformigenes]WAV96705.1 hypothetical protein NB645_07715 [Oxalobacter aliiformigenes]